MIAKSAVSILLATFSVVANAEDWGTVTGQIVVKGKVPSATQIIRKGDHTVKDTEICAAKDVYDNSLVIDPDSKGIAHCFVYLYRKPDRINDQAGEPINDRKATVYLDQVNCVFEPHTAVVRVGQTVEICNSDSILHNHRTSGFIAIGAIIPPNTPRGQGMRLHFEERSRNPVKIKCDYHPWMTAYWLVVDHPYAVITNSKGEFTIRNLPVGKHEFRVWHERVGWIEREYAVEVKEGNQTLPALEVDIQRFGESADNQETKSPANGKR